jgi:hypothetical protein
LALELNKEQMMEVIPKFLADKKRGISIALFAELCGLSTFHMNDVFVMKQVPLTEYVQRRVNRGYSQFINGEVAVMERYGKRYLEFRKQPKPLLARRNLVTYDGTGFRLDVGIRPRAIDYHRASLDDQLRRKNGRLS